MEDCECERRLSDPLDPPSEETMKRVSDVLEHYLKTMRELNRKSKLPIEVTEEHIKIINRFMEEKKTKKMTMTKAEAFEWLKHKKVAVVGDARAIQNKLFKIGYKWCDGSIVVMPMVGFLLIDDETFQFTESQPHFKNCAYEEISADDILSIEIVGEEDTSMPTVEFERYVKILQAWSKRLNSSFVFSERGMGIIRGDLLTKLEGEEMGGYYKVEATL